MSDTETTQNPIIEGEVKTGQTPPDPAPAAGSFALPENWKEAISPEFRDSEPLKLVKDVNTLAKNYIHAQKAIGADKVAVPSKHATDDDWKNFYKKVGLPDSSDKYEVKVKEGMKVDDGFLGEFKKAAFNANVLPHQAQKMMDWYMDKSGQILGEQEKSHQAQIESGLADLKKEYGAALPQKIDVAKNLLKEVGGDELAEEISTSDMANDPKFIKLLVKMADLVKDHPIKGQAVHGLGGMSPAEAMVEMAKLRSDGAYLDKYHPSHANTVAEMNRLAQVAYPE